MEQFYKLFFKERYADFYSFVDDSKNLPIETFYNKYHAIIGHPYYMMVTYEKPKDEYLSYLDFSRLAPHIKDEDYLFTVFAEGINFMSTVNWTGTFIDKQVRGLKKIMKEQLGVTAIDYDKKMYKNQVQIMEASNDHHNVMWTGYKFLLLDDELSKKYNHRILFLLRRTAFKRAYDCPDKMIGYFIADEKDVAYFKTIQTDTYKIYDRTLFTDKTLTDEANAYFKQFSDPNLPYDLEKDWFGTMNKIKNTY